MNNDHSIALWSTNPVTTKSAGFASYGFATSSSWEEPTSCSSATWAHRVPGELIHGSFTEVIDICNRFDLFDPHAALLLSASSDGIEQFLLSFANRFPGLPCVGGVAATHASSDPSHTCPGSVQLLLISTPSIIVETLNLHDMPDIRVAIATDPSDKRLITQIRYAHEDTGEKAALFFARLKKKFAIPDDNFECITLSDESGRNLHFKEHGDTLLCGANAPDNGRMVVRTTSRQRATEQFASFAQSDNSFIFGCAGLRSLIDTPFLTGNHSLAAFMFGEVITLNQKPCFGNLMLGKMVFTG